MKIIILFVLVVLLSGCETPVKNIVIKQEASHACCKTINQIDFQIVPSGEYLEFSLNEGSEVFQFDDEKSYLVAMELPAGNNYFDLKSFFNKTISGGYFHPYLLLLDENYNTIGSRRLSMTFSKRGKEKGHYMSGNVMLGTDNLPKYLVIYTKLHAAENESALVYPGQMDFLLGAMIGGGYAYGVQNPQRIELIRTNFGLIKFKSEKMEIWGN